MIRIVYNELLEKYNISLVENLRGLSFDQDFLSSWVPDSDIIRSVLSFFEEAQIYGITSIELVLISIPISSSDREALEAALVGSSSVVFSTKEDEVRILIDGLAQVVRPSQQPKAKINERVNLEAPQSDAAANSIHEDAPLRNIEWTLRHEMSSPHSESNISIMTKGRYIDISLDNGHAADTIRAAWHLGGTTEKENIFWDIFCDTIIDMTLVEAVAHGALKTIHRLADLGAISTPSGILLPQNAGRPLTLMQSLLNQLRFETSNLDYASVVSEFDLPPKDKWMDLTDKERESEIITALEEFNKNSIDPHLTVLFGYLEQDRDGFPIRVFVDFNGNNSAIKPQTARSLERFLKLKIEDKLQVYAIEVKDRNRIRRLSTHGVSKNG